MDFRIAKSLLANGVSITEDDLDDVQTIDYVDEIIQHCDLTDSDLVESVVSEISNYRRSFDAHRKIFNNLDDDAKVKYIEQVLEYEDVKEVFNYFDDFDEYPDPVNQLLFETGKDYFEYSDYHFKELAQMIGGWQYYVECLKEKEIEIYSKTVEDDIDILLQIPEEILMNYAEDIAYAIGNIEGYWNNKLHKEEIVQKFLDAGYEEFVNKLFEEGISGLSEDDFGVEIYIKSAKQNDMMNNRISVDEAEAIIDEKGLNDVLRVVSGHVGLEDMRFDHLYDIKEDKILAESIFKYNRMGADVEEANFKNRDFGDKKMPKDWFNNIIEEYTTKKES